MKWGVRRYQNSDGSLTDAGLKRYARLTKGISKQEHKIDKFERSLEKQTRRHTVKATKLRNRASKFEKKAYNSLFMSNKRRQELIFEANRLNAIADVKMAKSEKLSSKIKRAEAYIAKYNRKIDQFTASQIAEGEAYVESLSSKKKKTIDASSTEGS